MPLHPRQPLEIVEVDLEGPKAGEVLVEIKATGICHTDEFTRSGADPEGLFPAILGHEGAASSSKSAQGVTSLKKGDHVIPLYTPECRQCEYCLSGKTNLCQAIRVTQGQGVMPDGSSRFSLGGKKLFHYMGTRHVRQLHGGAGNRARENPRRRAVRQGLLHRLRRHDRHRRGASTPLKSSRAPTSSVFGLGGIGLNVIQGARLAGANMIVGVDLNPHRANRSREKFGMTHFVNPQGVEGDLVPISSKLTKGGADYSFECIGNVDVMRQALECCHKGWGVSVIIGVAGAGQEIEHAAVPARHGPGLERHRVRRREGPARRAEDRRLVHGRQDQYRRPDHAHA